ncbi:unnamed protein product, partial [Effrenium voratum]
MGVGLERSLTCPAKELFLQSKIHPQDLGHRSTLRAVEVSLRRLKTEYLDSMLLHKPYCWPGACASEPAGSWRDSWQALEEVAMGEILPGGLQVQTTYHDHQPFGSFIFKSAGRMVAQHRVREEQGERQVKGQNQRHSIEQELWYCPLPAQAVANFGQHLLARANYVQTFCKDKALQECDLEESMQEIGRRMLQWAIVTTADQVASARERVALKAEEVRAYEEKLLKVRLALWHQRRDVKSMLNTMVSDRVQRELFEVDRLHRSHRGITSAAYEVEHRRDAEVREELIEELGNLDASLTRAQSCFKEYRKDMLQAVQQEMQKLKQSMMTQLQNRLPMQTLAVQNALKKFERESAGLAVLPVRATLTGSVSPSAMEPLSPEREDSASEEDTLPGYLVGLLHSVGAPDPSFNDDGDVCYRGFLIRKKPKAPVELPVSRSLTDLPAEPTSPVSLKPTSGSPSGGYSVKTLKRTNTPCTTTPSTRRALSSSSLDSGWEPTFFDEEEDSPVEVSETLGKTDALAL